MAAQRQKVVRCFPPCKNRLRFHRRSCVFSRTPSRTRTKGTKEKKTEERTRQHQSAAAAARADDAYRLSYLVFRMDEVEGAPSCKTSGDQSTARARNSTELRERRAEFFANRRALEQKPPRAFPSSKRNSESWTRNHPQPSADLRPESNADSSGDGFPPPISTRIRSAGSLRFQATSLLIGARLSTKPLPGKISSPPDNFGPENSPRIWQPGAKPNETKPTATLGKIRSCTQRKKHQESIIRKRVSPKTRPRSLPLPRLETEA